MYIALIADVVGSRSLAATERAQLQLRLKELLATRAQVAAGRLASPFTLTLGDEFQAVYHHFHGVLGDLAHVQAGVAPVQLRWALAVGGLDTPVNPVAALEMDGPAFHEARAVMARLKKTPGFALGVGWSGGPPPELENAALALWARQAAGWKPATWKVLDMLLEGLSIEACAVRLGVTPRAVYKQGAGHGLTELRKLFSLVENRLDGRIQDVAAP